MNQTNFGKRVLYGTASGLFIGLGLPTLIFNVMYGGQDFTNHIWVFWALLVGFILFFLLGYKFPMVFEKVAPVGLVVGSPTILKGSVNRVDMQRKMPLWLGWFFVLLALACFILLFTRYIGIVPYIFGLGFVLFLIFIGTFYYKNK